MGHALYSPEDDIFDGLDFLELVFPWSRDPTNYDRLKAVYEELSAELKEEVDTILGTTDVWESYTAGEEWAKVFATEEEKFDFFYKLLKLETANPQDGTSFPLAKPILRLLDYSLDYWPPKPCNRLVSSESDDERNDRYGEVNSGP